MRAALIAGAALAGVGALAACGEDEQPPLPPIARALSTSACSPVTYGGTGRPRLLVVSMGPLQGGFEDHGVQNAQSVKLALAQRGWRAGRYSVGLQACDEVSAATGAPSERKCARNARAIADNPGVVALIGPLTSSCAKVMLPTLNRAPPGGVPVVAPAASYVGLTRTGLGAERGEPDRYYPTGRRHFARVVPTDDAQGAAAALFAKELGVRRPFVLHDGDSYGRGVASAFRDSARKLGMDVAGFTRWDKKGRGLGELAELVGRARPDGVYLAGYIVNAGPQLIKALRDRLGRDVELLSPDGFNQPATVVDAVGAGAEGFTSTIATPPIAALSRAGRRFASEFERRFDVRPCCYAVQTGQAAEIVLDAIAESDGTRNQILARIFATEVRGGILGSFRFDRNGDITQSALAVYRIQGGRLRFVKTITPDAALLGPG